MTAPAIELRNLSSLEDCRAVVGVQEEVWGKDGETAPASVLMVSAKRGGILIGACLTGGLPPSRNASADRRSLGEGGEAAANTLIGFVWSLSGVRDGAPTQWSHMLAVLPAFRHARVAEQLKLAQRERALAAGIDLIEWTFDPLQAVNAHFNLHVLGAVGASYGVDVYGALAGPLHRGTPTDRLIVDWRIRDPHVERRLTNRHGDAPAARLDVRSADVLDAPDAITTVAGDRWLRVAGADANQTSRRVRVSIPPRFLEMQRDATDVAVTWRLAVRDVMTSLFARGYRAVDFHLDRERGGGVYVFSRE